MVCCDLAWTIRPSLSIFFDGAIADDGSTAKMSDHESDHEIVPGLCLTSSGQISVDASLGNVLIELALEMEEPTDLPVDIEHVAAAIVLAVRSGELRRDTQISAKDPALVRLLTTHVRRVFEKFGDELGGDD